MNNDGIPNKALKRSAWANSLKKAAENGIKRTSMQSGNAGFRYAPNGKVSPPKAILVPNTQAFTDRFAITKQIARYVVAGGKVDVAGFDLHAFVYTPSTRLRTRINVYFESDDQLQDDPVFIVVPNWKIMNIARNPFSGRESVLQQLYPPAAAGPMDFNSNVKGGAGTTPLPDSFTLDNAGEVVRCDIHLANNQFNAVTFAPGAVNAFITATWEPNVPISDSELASFYRDCKLVYGIVPLIQKGVVP